MSDVSEAGTRRHVDGLKCCYIGGVLDRAQ